MKHEIDREWFVKQLDLQGKSLRGLARHLEIDASAASRMLSGERRMKMEEASQIAIFLGSTVSDVLKHAGVAVDADGKPTKIILAAYVDEAGKMERLTDPKPLPPSVVQRAQAAVRLERDSQIIAAQVRAPNGPLSIWDDAVILFAHTDIVEPSAIGSLAVCRLASGAQVLAKIERARKTGEAKIVSPSGDVSEVTLATATPIFAVIP